MASPLTKTEATPERLIPLAYRPKDAAAVLGVSRSTIYQMIAEGRLEARKIGAATVIPRASLLALFEAAPRTVAQTAE
jgi:excisionase family DNA binding protein